MMLAMKSKGKAVKCCVCVNVDVAVLFFGFASISLWVGG